MKIQTPILITALLLLQTTSSPAKGPISIPSETVTHMKKGKNLDLVWAVPGFDGTKGFLLGKVSNESEDEASAVLEYFPVALASLIKSDSPYTLRVAVVMVKLKSSPSGRASAKVEAEGLLVDKGGTVVAAFTAYAAKTDSGNEQDNARLAVRAIAFKMSKDLFPANLPSYEKSPAVMVAVPAGSAAPMRVAQIPGGQLPGNAPAPSVVSSASVLGGSQALADVPSPVLPAQPAVSSQSKPKVVPPPPSVGMPLIPAATAANMKKGSALAHLWISPDYDKASGFSIGEVSYQVQARNDGIDKYLPGALAEIAKEDAPCSLHFHIVELTTRAQGQSGSNSQLGVEGVLVTKDGTLVAAFATRESVIGSGDLVADYRTAARRVVLAISKELR